MREKAGPWATLCMGLGVLALPAWAQEEHGWSLGVVEQVVQDSNLLHAPAGQQTEATAVVSGLRLSLDADISRAHLKAKLSVDDVRYRNRPAFSHTGGKLSANLSWATVDRISGEMGGEVGQQFFRLDQPSQVQTGRMLERTRSGFAVARIGVVTDLTLEAGLSSMDRQYEPATVLVRDQRWTMLDLNARYQSNPKLMLRFGLRGANGAYRREGLADDDYQRRDLYFVGGWKLNDVSHLTGTAGWQRERHSLATARDSRTWYGSLGWRWIPTGKLTLETRLSHDSTAGSTENQAASSDAYRTTGASVDLQWLPTAKTRVSLLLRQTDRKLDNAFQSAESRLQAEDHTQNASISLGYQPLRWLDMSCSWGHTQRRSDSLAAGLTYPFSSTELGCALQAVMR